MQSSFLLQPQINHHILLVNLRKSIELWFLDKRDEMNDEWDGLYSVIQDDIAAIISHGLQLSMQSNKIRLKKFAEDLTWLRASIKAKHHSIVSMSELQTPKTFLSVWVQDNLKDNCLSSCLQLLVTDKEILNTYYTDYAFIRNEKYATALFICISAVELNRCSLLTQIDSILLSESPSKHKRATSHPNLSISPPPKRIPVKSSQDTFDSITSIKSQRFISTIRKWNSLPALKHFDEKKRSRSQTVGNLRDVSLNVGRLHQALDLHEKRKKTYNQAESLQSTSSSGYSKPNSGSNSSSSIGIELINCDDIKIWMDHTQTPGGTTISHNDKETPIVGTSSLDMNCEMPPNSRSSSSPINTFLSNIFSVPSFRGQSGSSWNESHSSMCYSSSNQNESVLNSFRPRCGEKLPPRKSDSMFEDVHTSQHVKPITPGQSVGEQSLAAFLQTTQFSRKNNDLERENAHFRICEAIISAIERIKCQREESEKDAANISGNNDCPGTSSTIIKCVNSNKDYISNGNEEATLNQRTIIATEDALNIKDHIPYAELDECSLNNNSAENIGLFLISKFNDKSLPKVSDLKWLVSEDDTPQTLLPLPQQSNNPDDNIMPTFTRGTRVWAPPRPQIIFTIHPSPKRKILIQSQNFRCAGCGMRVPTSHIKSFRYCTYLGKYHCTGCHRNQISAIPAKVLQLWDFNFYPVSVFAYRLLEQIWTHPLFFVPNLNPELYEKSKSLRNARLKRLQTKYVRDFITACRFAENEQMYFEAVPDYISTDPDTWSMSDLIDAKTKTIHRSLQDLIEKCEAHIFNCLLCKARGFICEFCQKDTVIYPWQTKVLRCDRCGSCYHANCWKSQLDCRKCQRLRFRQLEI